MQSNANVLQVENIITRFNTQDGKVFAVNGISFDLKEGELLGVETICRAGAVQNMTRYPRKWLRLQISRIESDWQNR